VKIFTSNICVIYKLHITGRKTSDVQFVNYTNVWSDGIGCR